MRVIQCPEEYRAVSERQMWCDVRLFVGGGITNCPDWQKEMIQRFSPKLVEGKPGPDFFRDLVMINPRRDDFDITDPNASKFQINWEHKHLMLSNAILFWFPYHTLCPITLYELGAAATRHATIFVGCHPAYARKFDVEEQLRLIRPSVKVHDNFADLVQEVTDWYNKIEKPEE